MVKFFVRLRGGSEGIYGRTLLHFFHKTLVCIFDRPTDQFFRMNFKIAAALLFGLIVGLAPAESASAGFNARADAEALRKAFKDGADEKAIQQILSNRNLNQRLEINSQFKTMYGKELIDDLTSKTSKDFKNLMIALITPTDKYLAKELKRATSDTDESVLVEIMCLATNQEIRAINDAYRTMFGKSLEDSLKKISDDRFRKFLISLNTANRDESTKVDQAAAKRDADNLYEAGENQFGTDGAVFNSIFAQRNWAQLNQIFTEYKKKTGHDIEEAIKSEFSNGARKAFLAIVKRVRNRAEFFAEQFNKAMAGFGTHDKDLIRLAVTHADSDINEIKKLYQQKYKESLEDAISSETSGEYKRGLLNLVS